MFKKITVLLLGLVMVLTLTVTSFGETKIAEPEITAEGAVVYCENTGEIVYSKNINRKLFPYSITKVLTVLLAVQKLPLDKQVTVSETAAAEKGSTMGLLKGEVLTVKDLIYGAMISSGNDASYALAEAVSGTEEEFIKLMNETAANIGCKNSQFTSSNGFDNETNKTTAYDMLQIIRVAFSNDIVVKAAGSKSYTVPATNLSKERVLKTHIAQIADSESGCYAAKTGYWDNNNASLVVAYKKNSLNLYIVLMGDTKKGRDEDIEKLIDYTTKTVQGAKVFDKDAAGGKVRIKHGEKTRLDTYAADVGYAYLPKQGSNSLISTKIVMKDDVKAPVKAGTVVGTYQIYVADEMVNEIPLIIKEDVKTGWFPSYIGISNSETIIICIVAVILLLIIFIIVILRSKNKRRNRKIREYKLMELARQQAELEREKEERNWRF